MKYLLLLSILVSSVMAGAQVLTPPFSVLKPGYYIAEPGWCALKVKMDVPNRRMFMTSTIYLPYVLMCDVQGRVYKIQCETDYSQTCAIQNTNASITVLSPTNFTFNWRASNGKIKTLNYSKP